MDYIYGKLDNNLVDINRIEYIQLKICNLDNNPIEGLKSGQYYLETKIVDSNLLIYTNLSALNKDDDDITSKIEKEIQDRINQGNTLQTNINNEAKRTDNMINQLNENVHSQFVALNKILVDSINTINGGIEEERQTRAKADNTLQDNLDKETARVNSMIDQINKNIGIIVDQLNKNIATIVETINTNLDNESKERLKQDTILDNRITEEVNKINDNAISDKDEINKRIDEEVATLNSTISSTKQELQTNIDAVDKDLQDKYEYAMESVTESFNIVRQTIIEETTRAKAAEQQISDNLSQEIQDRKDAITTLSQALDSEISRATAKENLLETSINNEKDRAIQAETTLQSNINAEAQQRQEAVSTLTERIAAEEVRAATEEANLDKEIKAEAAERINADNDLSQRIGNLEGKTTRLYYGEGTLSSPTATEIQQFITNLEVDPPYEPPYSGIAVVVKLTDENTYHIWHYYANLNTWKDDGVDLVNTFTNDFKGIIQGTISVGYISAENGFGKVNGWENLNTTISNNYTILDNKINSSVSTLNSTISSLSTRLDTKIDKEISDRQSAITSLSNTLTTSINNEILRATEKENEIISSLSLETQARIDNDNTLSTNLNKEIQDRKDVISSLSTTLTNSINSVNSTLSKAIKDEADRAKGVENNLSSNIDSTLSTLNSHTANKNNPHVVTKEQLDLGNVDNTSDLDKPISKATQKELDSIKETLSILSSTIETLSNRVDSIDIYFEDLGEI